MDVPVDKLRMTTVIRVQEFAAYRVMRLVLRTEREPYAIYSLFDSYGAVS